jgi:hypothetical protein
VALVMAIYFKLSFKKGSAVQNPEKLYREPSLMIWFTATIFVIAVLLIVRLPWLERAFIPTIPQVQTGDQSNLRRPADRQTPIYIGVGNQP